MGKLVLFGQKWFYLAKGACNWANWLYLDKLVLFGQKVVLFGQIGCFFEKVVLIGQKVVLFGSGCIWANWFYLGKLVVFEQIGSIWEIGCI